MPVSLVTKEMCQTTFSTPVQSIHVNRSSRQLWKTNIVYTNKHKPVLYTVFRKK